MRRRGHNPALQFIKNCDVDKTNPAAQTVPEVKQMKEEEKKPLSWEIADPKLPVIQSGHMENRKK